MATRPFRIEDGNENICGACLKSGTLICCEHCPAAFHPECAGYRDIGCVPEGDWYCFLCSRKLGVPFMAGTPFKGEIGQAVMVAYDRHNEVFEKGVVTDITEQHVTIRRRGRYLSLRLEDSRIWHGTLDSASWSTTPGGRYRPNSRAFEIDYQQIATLDDPPEPDPEPDPEPEPEVETEPEPEIPTEGTYTQYLTAKKAQSREKHFLDLLTHFWKVHIGVEDIQWPAFGYVVSLSDLWDGVQKRGGFLAVCEKSGWTEIVQEIIPNPDHRNFAFLLKHTFQTILLDVESYGGVEAMETLKETTPLPESHTRQTMEEGSPPEAAPKKRRRLERSRKKRPMPTADELISAPTVAEDVVSATTGGHVWPKAYSASRAVQEYRSAIGIVSLTDTAKNLKIGDKVDVRLYRDSSLGPWRAARILTMATASAFEGYRRYRVKFSKSKDSEQFPVLPDEWVTLLARPSSWGTTLTQPSVLVRPPVKPYFPPVRSAAVRSLQVGDRIEAWLHKGWWPATILSLQDDQALLQGDLIPLGEGLKWITTLSYIRTAPGSENEGYGMIQPLNMEEELYPKDLERRLNVTVDRTEEGHLILSFKRLDQAPNLR